MNRWDCVGLWAVITFVLIAGNVNTIGKHSHNQPSNVCRELQQGEVPSDGQLCLLIWFQTRIILNYVNDLDWYHMRNTDEMLTCIQNDFLINQYIYIYKIKKCIYILTGGYWEFDLEVFSVIEKGSHESCPSRGLFLVSDVQIGVDVPKVATVTLSLTDISVSDHLISRAASARFVSTLELDTIIVLIK